jgi:hypothetical protein
MALQEVALNILERIGLLPMSGLSGNMQNEYFGGCGTQDHREVLAI